MTNALYIASVIFAAYLIGAVPFGYLIARARGVDLFKEGSGNIGATNAGRILGRRFGILVFALDFAKGALPVVAARLFTPLAADTNSDEIGVYAGLAAIIGHLFPVYLRFRGGKGVATGAGVVSMLLPLAALCGLLVWFGIVSATRYVSVASMAAAITLCVVRFVGTNAPFVRENLVLTLFCLAAAGLVIFRHHANIRRLLNGQEGQLKDNAAMQSLSRVVHVLALGLWFGSAVFFSLVVGLSLFGAAGDLAKKDSPEATWFKVPATFANKEGKINGRYEYGSRIAGQAISPMFDVYFPLQGICGFLAIATAWGWQYRNPSQKIHRRRVTILLLALASVVIGWPLERHVSSIRDVRHEKMDAYFQHADDAKSAEAEALAAKADFGLWHTVSLFLNFATIILVTVGMAMAAWLPAFEQRAAVPPERTETAGTGPPAGMVPE